MADDGRTSLLELLLEVQNLDRLSRTGYAMRGVSDPESVSEHSWQLSFLVWALGSRVDGLDLSRAIELALVHDIAEVRVGDLPRVSAHYFPPGAKKAAEHAAAADLLAPLGARGQAAFDEFEAGDTLEARFVRACDQLQMLLKVTTYERQGQGALGDFWRRHADFDDGGFVPVREVFDQLKAARSADRR